MPYTLSALCAHCYDKRYRETKPDCRDPRRRNAKQRFNLSLEEYDALRDKQREEGDLCGVCRRPLGKDRAHLDHNHKTKKLREFVHRDCNLAIGLLEDDPHLCRLAAEYLERHGE